MPDLSDEKFFMAILHGKNSYLASERHALIHLACLIIFRTRRNISTDVAFYASCNPEQLPFAIREFYKDSFDKICTELLVDIRSEIDQIYESFNLDVSRRMAPERKAELVESLPLSSFYFSGKSFKRLFNGKYNEDKLIELQKRQSAILNDFDLSHHIIFQRLISNCTCHK